MYKLTNNDLLKTPFRWFVWEASELTAAFVLEEDYKLFLGAFFDTQFRKHEDKDVQEIN